MRAYFLLISVLFEGIPQIGRNYTVHPIKSFALPALLHMIRFALANFMLHFLVPVKPFEIICHFEAGWTFVFPFFSHDFVLLV